MNRGTEGWEEHPDLRKQERVGRALQVEGVKGKDTVKHEAGMQNTTNF